MTVAELRKALEGLPDDMPVILQKDHEGNGYSPCDGADSINTYYVAETTYMGEVRTETNPDRANGVPCVVLFPAN